MNYFDNRFLKGHPLQLISNYYGTNTAERSGVPLINHIYEGLVVLDYIAAPKAAMNAFCLHPIVQADNDLGLGLWTLANADSYELALAMEYRHQANKWLSDKVSKRWYGLKVEGEPSYGPLRSVRDMLIADKVQNFKDFLRYHYATHPRSKELTRYFIMWLEKLNVSVSYFEELCCAIDEAKYPKDFWGVKHD